MIDEREYLIQQILAVDELLRKLKDNRLGSFEAFEKQVQALALTQGHSITAVLGGNGSGKSVLLQIALAVWTVGFYPDWWQGRRFDGRRSMRLACGGNNFKIVRNVIQRALLGPPNDWGSGLIPRSRLHGGLEKGIVRAAGSEKNIIDTVYVDNFAGGVSELSLKSYTQGVEAWMAEAYDVVGCDEEPPMDIFQQAIQRVGRRNGVILMSFTPEKGASEVVNYITEEEHPGVAHIFMSQDDNPHLPLAKIEEMAAQTPDYLKDTKRHGIPQRGVGAVYPVPDSMLECDYFEIPSSWRRGIGMDFGWEATAAVWMAYDPQNDIIYVYREYKRGDAELGLHVQSIKTEGVPVFGDPAGGQRTQTQGVPTFEIYAGLGMNITPAESNSHAYLDAIRERMQRGGLKVVRDACPMWFHEKRRYHRTPNGEVAKKQDDHLLDAMRYGIVMLGKWRSQRVKIWRPPSVGADYDPYG